MTLLNGNGQDIELEDEVDMSRTHTKELSLEEFLRENNVKITRVTNGIELPTHDIEIELQTFDDINKYFDVIDNENTLLNFKDMVSQGYMTREELNSFQTHNTFMDSLPPPPEFLSCYLEMYQMGELSRSDIINNMNSLKNNDNVDTQFVVTNRHELDYVQNLLADMFENGMIDVDELHSLNKEYITYMKN